MRRLLLKNKRPPRSTPTDTLFPYTTHFRSLSEPAVRDLVLKIARGGGYDPDVHLNQAAAADVGEGLLRHHPQDLALGGERHVGDLVEEQRPAMRLFQQAGADKRCDRRSVV